VKWAIVGVSRLAISSVLAEFVKIIKQRDLDFASPIPNRGAIKKSSLIAVATAFIASPAMAADIPFKAPLQTVVPVYSWTGVYAGLNAGGAWGDSETHFTPTGILVQVPIWITDLTNRGSPRLHPSGFTGGGQIGFNWQTGNWVLGAEADFQCLGLSTSTKTQTFNTAGLDPYFFAASIRTDWLATVRPRIGIAFDRALIYVTGGLAVANQKFSHTLNFFCSCGPFLDVNSGTISSTTTGWVVGAGLDYMWTNNWSVRAEYLHVDLGMVDFASFNTINRVVTANHSEDLKVDIARVAINYKFDWGAPLVRARY